MSELLVECAKRLKLSQLRSHINELSAEQVSFLEKREAFHT